ncbi:hypothetical protein F5144DRAFT_561218 [Chaetomium tenue]|uniref:Uncharacterized protein n=1 Tax=Chaetomium tenue TaxID=1854479 RepID=A0ACB7PKS1_9PEZI|nr:hypothetical protein F5144DRAFT_561218 [Chaetomium globosum]
MIRHPLNSTRSLCSPLLKTSKLTRTARSPCSSGRHFSVKAIYSSFPATLHYYSPQKKVVLFDHKGSDNRSQELFEEAVTVAKDGLVYPTVNAASMSNGAVMFPNTFMMQELVRRYFDEVLDRQDEGEDIEAPSLYTVPKGTPIPSHLILINEYISRFSLQPSHGMSLEDLNRSLNEFYERHAKKETVDSWLENHPFPEALPDEADERWKAQ